MASAASDAAYIAASNSETFHVRYAATPEHLQLTVLEKTGEIVYQANGREFRYGVVRRTGHVLDIGMRVYRFRDLLGTVDFTVSVHLDGGVGVSARTDICTSRFRRTYQLTPEFRSAVLLRRILDDAADFFQRIASA